MGKVKAWCMDLEEQFFEAAADVCHECESFEEFEDVMKPQLDLVRHMDKEEIHDVMCEIWNDVWSDYN